MENDVIQEITLTDAQIGEGCVRHSLAISSDNEATIELTLDNYPPVSFSRSKPISAKEVYDVFHFSPGAKYELHGLKSFGPMAEGVYTDFFSLIRNIVVELNALGPNPIVMDIGRDDS